MHMEECEHEIVEKYVTRHGLVCRDCLTEADFKAYPGMKERLARRDRKAEIARQNFHHTNFALEA